MNEWILIGGMALVTFAIRYLLIAFSDRLHFSPKMLQALGFVPPAVLTAIIAPAVVMPAGTLWIGPDNARLIGAIAAVGIGAWRKNLLLTIVTGMGTFLTWQWLVG
ncbi:MAG: AzlD domain-containing protein [Nodosilinea sp.]